MKNDIRIYENQLEIILKQYENEKIGKETALNLLTRLRKSAKVVNCHSLSVKIESAIAGLESSADLRTVYLLQTDTQNGKSVKVASTNKNLLLRCVDNLKKGTKFEFNEVKISNNEREIMEKLKGSSYISTSYIKD